MATPDECVALGVPTFVARLLGASNDVVTSQGSSFASATPLNGGNRHYLVTASNSGAGLAMPAVGGEPGVTALRGDFMEITNILSASIVLYFGPTAKGSLTTIYVDGASVTGLTGVSVASAKPLLLRPISASTWVGLRSA